MITVLRLGHRIGRDVRISTHCGLAARALGADRIIYSGEHDSELVESVRDVSERWGGSFRTEYRSGWMNVIKECKRKKYLVVHLTVYGLPLQKEIAKIRKSKKLLVIIGGEKMPPAVYRMTDYNISVTSQPHSEVAALSLFLHEYFKGKELEKRFSKPKIKVIPQKSGKKVIRK